MTFKPRKPVVNDLRQLRTVLNQTGTSLRNNPLYQFCNQLLEKLSKDREVLLAEISRLEALINGGTEMIEGGGGEAFTQHMFVTDGGSPNQIIDDGFGNPITVEFEP